MGINANGARFLLYAEAFGIDFTQTAMIGRQNIYVTTVEMRRVLEAFGRTVDENGIAQICGALDGFSESFFRYLGAKVTHSFDYSDYQKSTHVHDMNEPISEKFKDQYSVVLDGGSLEHIFNFPVAIKNCMEMVNVGGHYLAITPANNLFGHGFYQFSPELYYSVLSEVNGFQLEKMIAFEEKKRPIWYSVKSPREVSARVTLSNCFPVYLLIIAKKIARRPIFEPSPQQSDYTVIWSSNDSSSDPPKLIRAITERPFTIRLAKMLIPASIRRAMRKVWKGQATKSVFDPEFFVRMNSNLMAEMVSSKSRQQRDRDDLK